MPTLPPFRACPVLNLEPTGQTKDCRLETLQDEESTPGDNIHPRTVRRRRLSRR